MEFVLEQLPTGKDGKELLSWFLLLTTKEDVLAYLRIDVERYLSALQGMQLKKCKEEREINVRLDHLSGNREVVIATALKFRMLAAKEGEKVYPILVINDVAVEKAKSMTHHLNVSGVVQINEAGGWCGHERFLEIHNAKIIERRPIEDGLIQFPQGDPLTGVVLILENDGHIDNNVYSQALEISEKRYKCDPSSIKNLKDKDQKWVAKSIANAAVIVTETRAVDPQQLNSMMKLFSKLQGKEIHIRTEFKETITGHPLFETNNQLHKVLFF